MTEHSDDLPQTDAQWRARLTPEQYAVCRQHGTEPAFTGKYWDEKAPGTYLCAGCGQALFESDTKFDSGSGWPSFTEPIPGANIEMEEDRSHGMRRIEVHCRSCGSHLGHVFPDGPPERGGQRFCVNSCSLSFEEKP